MSFSLIESTSSGRTVVSRCFPGGYNVKLNISRGRLAWWLLAFLQSGYMSDVYYLSLLHPVHFLLCGIKLLLAQWVISF